MAVTLPAGIGQTQSSFLIYAALFRLRYRRMRVFVELSCFSEGSSAASSSGMIRLASTLQLIGVMISRVTPRDEALSLRQAPIVKVRTFK